MMVSNGVRCRRGCCRSPKSPREKVHRVSSYFVARSLIPEMYPHVPGAIEAPSIFYLCRGRDYFRYRVPVYSGCELCISKHTESHAEDNSQAPPKNIPLPSGSGYHVSGAQTTAPRGWVPKSSLLELHRAKASVSAGGPRADEPAIPPPHSGTSVSLQPSSAAPSPRPESASTPLSPLAKAKPVVVPKRGLPPPGGAVTRGHSRPHSLHQAPYVIPMAAGATRSASTCRPMAAGASGPHYQGWSP